MITFKLKLKKKIAEEDIRVVIPCEEKDSSLVISTYPRKREYELNKVEKLLFIFCIRRHKVYRYYRGLDSFKSEYYYAISGKTEKMFRAIIPKGSKYYTDGIRFCSNKLKVISDMNIFKLGLNMENYVS